MSQSFPARPKMAVHKFTSCDGCQLAFLNAGEALLELAQKMEIVHFAEAGYVDPDAEVDVAFVEGSVTTPEEADRIRRIRERSRYLIAFGVCATAGGVQALRNLSDGRRWVAEIYPAPEHIDSLPTSTPFSAHVRVDRELWGCPPNTQQVMRAVRSLLYGAVPEDDREKVCLECKRKNNVCVLVAKGEPCMGPVTRTGCGALCPSFSRDCYACYGPGENPNTSALAGRFEQLGLSPDAIARRFWSVTNGAPAFRQEGGKWGGAADD